MQKLIHIVCFLLFSSLVSSPCLSSQNNNDKRFEECKTKLKTAKKLDVLYDLDWKPPKDPYVVVGRTFFTIPIDAKEGFVETLGCFLSAGDPSIRSNFDILDWRNGKKVGRFSSGKLRME